MRLTNWSLSALMLCFLPTVSQAADNVLHLPFEQVVQEAINAGKLDGSVKFYLDSSPRGASIVRTGVTTTQRTNGFNKSDDAACSWALQSALIRMQNSAKNAGANAVVNLSSLYRHSEYRDSSLYECHAGTFIVGVGLKGDFARVR